MSDTIITNEQQAVAVAAALARSRVYRFLGTAFLPPGRELPSLLSEAQETECYLPYDRTFLHQVLEEVATLVDSVSTDDYRRIFGHTIPQEYPPYETQYGGGHIFQQTQILGDISGFYRAFGLEVSDETKERPDHISVELEFMYTLTHKEAHALAHDLEEQAEMCMEAQRTFIEEHVGQWVPLFARQLGERADGFYRALAETLVIFIDMEARFLRVEPTVLDLRSSLVEPIAGILDNTEMIDTENSL